MGFYLLLQRDFMEKYINSQTPNIQIQIGAMKAKFPQFRCICKGRNLTFVGELLIKPELPIYKVTVEYRGNLRPLVHVISPKLVDNAKHVYADGSLCLYHPDNFKWYGKKLIANEIMQWTIAWIYFHEYWLQSNEWIGPEVPHKKNINKYE